MAKYIDCEAIEKFIEDGLNNPDEAKRVGHDAIEIMAEVHYMDAADVVEVVRCPQCKHHHDLDVHFCMRHGIEGPDDAEFFCKYGEREEAKY